MVGKSASLVVVGMMLGMLISVCSFALLVRSRNLQDAGGRDVTTLKLAHSLDQNHPVHLAMEFMARRLDEKSTGAVRLEIFPNGQLGSETAIIEQLQRGALAMAKTSTAPLESFIPEMAVFGVPYLFRDEQHFWQVLDGKIGAELLQSGQELGLYGLCYYDAGARSFYTVDTPILKPSDLNGLKLRVQQSKTAMEMVEALGGSPTPMSFGELYTGLQQRMVDGAENNPPSFHSNRHSEVCKHYSLDEHTRVPDLLLFSWTKWRQLPTQVQQWVQEAADESANHQRELWRRKTEETLAAVRREGVTIHHPDKSLFAAQVEDMHADLEQTSVGDLIRRVRKVR